MDPHHSQSRFKLHNLPPTIPTPTSPYSPYRGMFGGYGHACPARFSQLRYPPLLSRHASSCLVRPEYIPPPPPLLKLGQHQHSSSSGSGSQQFYNDHTSSPLTSHLIGLLRQPTVSSLTPSTPASPPSPGPIPLTVSDALAVSPTGPLSSSSSTQDDRDPPVVSEESSDFSNIEPSNASKCKEYRERNKEKRKKGEEEYQLEYEKHKKLKATYDRQKKTIKRLKEYYLKLLKKGELTCPKGKKARTEDDKEEEETSADIEPPLLTIKTEIELNVTDIIVKNER